MRLRAAQAKVGDARDAVTLNRTKNVKGECKMEQIVNPAFFYWASVFSGLKVASIILTVVCFIVLTIMFFYYDSEYNGWDDDDEFAGAFRKNMKRIAVAIIVMVMIMIFVPSKQTMIEMQIAKMATGDNISAVIEKITEVAKEIIESAK